MKLEKAMRLVPGQFVTCPPERGNAGFRGKIVQGGGAVQQNASGIPFVWISVRGPAHISIWPSNRLS